jgi:hypothetical protein
VIRPDKKEQEIVVASAFLQLVLGGQVREHDFFPPVHELLAASLGVRNLSFFDGNFAGRERYWVE